MVKIIPLFKPMTHGDEEKEAVARVLESGWWALGPETEKFEQEFADYVGVRYAVGVNSATSALELAARATGATNGVVICPALTFVSTAQAMLHANNKVIFADVDEDTLCISWPDVYEKLKEAGRSHSNHFSYVSRLAVVPVWYAGNVQTLPPYLYDRDVTVIEDCAHAAGSLGAGCQGKASAWSFQAVKNLACGDGGMVTTNDEEVYERLKPLRWCGIDRSTWERDHDRKYNWDYSIPADGEKMHMNDIAAAIGRVQLRHLDRMNNERMNIVDAYDYEFENLHWLKRPNTDPAMSNHMYVVRVGERNRFIDHMLSNGVSAGVHYKPLTHYHNLFPGNHSVPVTERVWQTMVTLPLFPSMTDSEVEQVVQAVRSFKP